MATMTYFDHASLKLRSDKGTVIYIDPFAPGDYSEPADVILVTHDHFDHNQTSLVTKKAGCRTITFKEAHEGGGYGTFEADGVKIEAVAAYNKNHKKEECVGFIVTLDNVTVYHAGDTSKIPEMAALAARKLDYALLPMDGYYNMGAPEASECAAMIKAKHTVPIHVVPRGPDSKGVTFSREAADRLSCEGKLIVEAGETITL
ncbi:MAG: MBL fold metallo-hydrolase [Clostridia bacterium]|nr:MBL fold metallo-hydrolase [Clostridia bacterium]